MKDSVHSNEKPFKDGMMSVPMSKREYAVIQLALYQFITNVEQNYMLADKEHLRSIGITESAMKSNEGLVMAAKAAAAKLEMQGFGLTMEILRKFDTDAERDVKARHGDGPNG